MAAANVSKNRPLGVIRPIVPRKGHCRTFNVPDTPRAGLIWRTTTDAPSQVTEAFVSSGRLDEVENSRLRIYGNS